MKNNFELFADILDVRVFFKNIALAAKIDRPDHKELEAMTQAKKQLFSLYHRMESGERRGYLFFDLDGVLVKAGVETAAHPSTLEDYIDEHAEEVVYFREKMEDLKRLGFRVGINTGRGAAFCRRIKKHFFPHGMIDKIICEGGAEILAYTAIDGEAQEHRIVPKSVDQESAKIIRKYREDIAKHVIHHLHGEIESGKEAIISLNPGHKQEIAVFYEQVKDYLKKIDILHEVKITHSATAVDITPKGADKLRALIEVLEDDMSVYFGDAKSDEEAMMRSVVNIVPGNGMASTKKQAESAAFGIIAERREIGGIVDALKVVELFFRYAKGKYSIKS